MPKHPLAEVFGFPIDNLSPEADRYRKLKLCPYNNKVPSCTKDKAENPLGVCSVFEGDALTITCPVRFRQDWLIAEDAAAFFFPEGTSWTSLTEIRLDDKHGRSAGNIRKAFDYYMEAPASHANMDWSGKKNYPRPDYLSSSRKRLAPQLIYKGGILHAWGKKTAVALNRRFYETLPSLEEVEREQAEIAWLIYDLQHDAAGNRYQLTRYKTVYTQFGSALDKITRSEAGQVAQFLDHLQEKLDEKLENGSAPDAPTLLDALDS